MKNVPVGMRGSLGRGRRGVLACNLAGDGASGSRRAVLGCRVWRTLTRRETVRYRCRSCVRRGCRGRSSMVELQPSKLVMRVRFPSPAPAHQQFRFAVHMIPVSGRLPAGKTAYSGVFPARLRPSNRIMVTRGAGWTTHCSTQNGGSHKAGHENLNPGPASPRCPKTRSRGLPPDGPGIQTGGLLAAGAANRQRPGCSHSPRMRHGAGQRSRTAAGRRSSWRHGSARQPERSLASVPDPAGR
jgi:hypothetical protein